jgi:hypothetical protein
MRRSLAAAALVVVAGAIAVGRLPGTRAADHADGPATTADPTADITDVFTWMSEDARQMYLAMGIGRNVGSDFRFSDSVQYVFHTNSKQAFSTTGGTPYDIICEFDVSGDLRCWAGNDYFVGGDPNGIQSQDGRFRAYAGLRNDSFFFNLTGFKDTAKIVGTVAPSLAFDAAGCPKVDAATSAFLVNQLKTQDGAPAKDDFLHFNLGMIVVAVDKSLVTHGGPIVGVWGSTHRKS